MCVVQVTPNLLTFMLEEIMSGKTSVAIIEDVLTNLGYEPRQPGVNELFYCIQRAASQNWTPTSTLKMIGELSTPYPKQNMKQATNLTMPVAWFLVTGMARLTRERLYNWRQGKVLVIDDTTPVEIEPSDKIPDFTQPSKAGKQIIETLLTRIRAGLFHLPSVQEVTLSGAA